MFKKSKHRNLIIGRPATQEDLTPTYEHYKKDIPVPTNQYNIIIQKKGKFEFLKIQKPVTEETFTFKFEEETYKVIPEAVYPKDEGIIQYLIKKIKRIKIRNEFNIFFKDKVEEALIFPKKDKITSSLLHTVLNAETTRNMLKNIMHEEGVGGFDFGSLKIVLLVLVCAGVGTYLAFHFGLIDQIMGMIA